MKIRQEQNESMLVSSKFRWISYWFVLGFTNQLQKYKKQRMDIKHWKPNKNNTSHLPEYF